MKSPALYKRFVSAASALVMFMSFATALSSGSRYVYAEEADSFVLEDLNDNGIPVLYIDIDETAEGYGTIEEMNESYDHSVKCTGTVRLDVPDGYTGDYSEEALKDTKDLKLDYIRGRGNSTWGADKKPYKIKLDKSADLLGMGKNKHWALLANSGDDTLLKNRLTSYIGDRLGLDYTPQMLPVDVVMNGRYLGNYYLSETVRIGNSRVEIDELTQTDNEDPEVTGGYLLAMGRENDPEDSGRSYRHIVTKGGEVFFSETPEFYTDYSDDETGTDAQFAYISNYIQKIEDAIMSDDFKDNDGVDVGEYLDLGSTASYWWVNNFLKNFDAFATTSTYLYKERNGKLFFGPLWDFDQSMTGSSTSGFYKGNTLWLNRLRAYNAEYQEILFEKWDELDGIITDIVREGGVIDKYIAELYASEQDNEKLWGIKENYAESGMDFDYLNHVEELRSWLKERQQWVRDNVGEELTKARFRVTYMSGGEVLKVDEQDYMSEIFTAYLPPVKPGCVFKEWLPKGGTAEDIPAILKADLTLTASYIPEEEAVMADNIYFSSYDVWFDVRTEGDRYSPTVIAVPEDTQEKVYEWSSSDPEVASVDNEGRVTPYRIGETEISVKLRNGIEKKYTFHVYDSQETPPQEATELNCENETITVNVGEYAQIVVSPSPAPYEDLYIDFSTDSENVIELIDGGVFRALSPGEATVRINAFDGPETFCKVIVTEKEPEESSQSAGPESKPESGTSSNPKTGAAAGIGAIAVILAVAVTVKKERDK
ncbi:MAG: CotH kinase family protein [Ruminococcus sp.]|nr:CotH kinase family protein [Ruminococcus sp.]